MARQPAPADLALDDQLLTHLRTHAPIPLPTYVLAHRTRAEDAHVLRRLRRLVRRHQVVRESLPGWRCAFWRAAE
jgi:hypothetical protein